MRRAAVSNIADAIALPLLYETRTILRLRRSAQVTPRSSSTLQYAEATERNRPPEGTSFLKAKAAASKPNSKGTGTTATTITHAERRVFDDIFNQVAGKSPPKVAGPLREKRDTFIDHEEILSIFSSAVSRHVAERKALAETEAAKEHAGRYGRTLNDEEEMLQRYPQPLRKAARRAAAAAIAAEEQGTPEDSASRVVTNAGQESEVSWKSSQKESGRAEEQGTLEDLAQKSEVSGESSHADSSRADLDEADVHQTDLVDKQNHPDGQDELSTSDESVTPRTDQLPGLRPSFLVADKKETHFHKGFRPSFLTIEKRAEDVTSFAQHYGAVRPSFVRRAEDAAVVQEKLHHDPEAVFQGTIHRYCREEMGQIADAFQKAVKLQGDVGIWNTSLAKVFPMIELLHVSLRKEKLSHHNQGEEPTQKSPSDVSNPNTPETSIILSPAESPLPDLPPYVPPLYIISRLYPAALLLAFRLLRIKFPTSPLTLALLPQIRSLGPTSYVLGASTEFYNALIELRWDVYSDLQGIDGLLVEMERSGVAFDVGTWNTLVKVGGERFNDLHRADGGVRGLGFWERPHNIRWFQKVAVEWKMVVAGRLREQGLAGEISEREYVAAVLPEARQADAEEGTVWL